MKKVKLLTRDGAHVTTVNCLDMNPMPEVIIWGTRVFVLQAVESAFGEYREVFAFYALNEPVKDE